MDHGGQNGLHHPSVGSVFLEETPEVDAQRFAVLVEDAHPQWNGGDLLEVDDL